MYQRSRREFLEESMFATAAALAASAAGTSASRVLAEDKASKSPNEKLSVAVVGTGGRGGDHLGNLSGRNTTDVTHICDVDEKTGQRRVEEVGKKQGKAPKYVKDLREVFDDKSVDIVTTATPNHWHSLCAIWAMQAGKDVYVEKPVSHNVSEGRRVVETARKHNRICQTGTQSRSSQGLRDAIAWLHAGNLGEVKVARGTCYKRRPAIGPKGVYPVPENIDYNLWCGPASDGPVTRPKFHYDWHWQFEYGNGDLGNQGIHQMDIARWGLNVMEMSNAVLSYGGRLGYEDAGDTANTQISIHDYGTRTLVFEVRGLETQPYRGSGVGVIFDCADGYMVVPSYSAATAFDKKGQMIKSWSAGGDHYENFIQAVKSRKHTDLNADILDGHLSSALCHTSNISYRLGSKVSNDDLLKRLAELKTNDDVKDTFERTRQHLIENKVDLAATPMTLGPWLAFDPKKEMFVNNAEADALLTRKYRAPFIVPAAGEV